MTSIPPPIPGRAVKPASGLTGAAVEAVAGSVGLGFTVMVVSVLSFSTKDVEL
jgi:hypothetical protein